MKLSSKALKNATLGLSALMMLGAGQAAFAHASILNTINSGTAVGSTSFSRIGVNHACNNTTPILPVVAQSVVIPTISPVISANDPVNSPLIPQVGTAAVPASGTPGQPGYVAAVPASLDYVAAKAAGSYYTILPTAGLGDYLATTLAGTIPVTTLANRFQLVQSKDVFTSQIEQRVGANVIGWVSTKGSLGLNLHGEVPFRFSNVFFKPASCVRSVVIQLAVADICKTTQPVPYTGVWNSGSNGVNLWIDSTLGGSPSFPVAAIEPGAGTTNLTINRDPIANPYPANCANAPVAANGVLSGTFTAGADALYDVKIQPSAADLEQLQFPGWGTPVSGNTFQ